MRCLNCRCLSIKTFCKSCKKILSEHTLSKREFNGFKVYSFYKYSDIKNLIHSKHHLHGVFIYKNLAKLSFTKFAKTFKFDEKILAIPLDDNIKSDYSHTAILAKALNSSEIKPVYNALRANSDVKYSGKSLKFRLQNKRDFKILKKINKPVILVDDLITTGSTMKEAFKVCQKAGINVLFVLTLADAKE